MTSTGYQFIPIMTVTGCCDHIIKIEISSDTHQFTIRPSHTIKKIIFIIFNKLSKKQSLFSQSCKRHV